MPCSNTSRLNQYEIEQEKRDHIQQMREKRAEDLFETYKEDAWFWLEHINELGAKELLFTLWHTSQNFELPTDERFFDMTETIESSMQIYSERQATQDIP